MREAGTERDRRRRVELFALLGDRCAAEGCPNDDPRGWQVDHVEGGGTVEREAGLVGRKFIERVKANPAEYQILCAYHHQIKRVEQQEHVGRRVYERVVPTERIIGPGSGNSAAGRAALEAARTPEAQASRARLRWSATSAG